MFVVAFSFCSINPVIAYYGMYGGLYGGLYGMYGGLYGSGLYGMYGGLYGGFMGLYGLGSLGLGGFTPAPIDAISGATPFV